MRTVFPTIDANIRYIKSLFEGRGDFVEREIPSVGGFRAWVCYVDGLCSRDVIDFAVFSKLAPVQGYVGDVTTADIHHESDLDNIITAVLSGDAALFVYKDDKLSAHVIAAKGFANRGVTKAESESVVQGSQEAFTEAIRINTALIRRRIRDTRLMVKQIKIGTRSKTDIAIVYLEDVVRPAVLDETLRRIGKMAETDAVFDVGMVAQTTDDEWKSAFPQSQITERPDKAASAVCEGRIAVVADNSPYAMLIPATVAAFMQSGDDYYERFQVMSFIRVLRYAAAIMSVILPSLYLAAAVFNPSVLPTSLALKMAGARADVPFPAVFEILLMEAAFELLREAGLRLPGNVGGAVGIVGGLIVGQCAVEAGLVSAPVVIVVAATGICGFCVPNYSLSSALRVTKYFVLACSAALGLFGLWLGVLVVCSHLTALTSYGFPYMFPYAAGEVNRWRDVKDSLFRAPLFKMRKRPIFANPEQRERK